MGGAGRPLEETERLVGEKFYGNGGTEAELAQVNA